MTSFLTEELKNTFACISLDYTYQYPLQFFDRVKRSISSTSDKGHYEILLHMMEHDCIPYDGIAYGYLQDMDMYKAANRLAELGDMIFHNIKSAKSYYSSILYCPPKLTEYQQLRLRLWYEFLSSINTKFGISCQDEDRNITYEHEQVIPFLEERKIFDDEYIHSLTKKYPDYKG